jgi:hypothetical protein
MARETREDEPGPQEFNPFDFGGRFGQTPRDPWRMPAPGYNPQQPPQQVQPQRRDAYGQPQRWGDDPRVAPQPRSNPGFFWNSH